MLLVWQTSETEGLKVQYASPLPSLPGFSTMDFAAAPSGREFAVAGAVGKDVALILLRLEEPR